MSPEDINYKVIVTTGESGIDANVILCIFGEDDTTTNLALTTTKDGSSAKFDKDSTLEFDLKAVNVGKIKKINIGHDGKGSEQQWFLKSIQIDKNDKQYTFQVNRWLSEEKDDHKTYIDLTPDKPKTPPPSPPPKDQAKYRITIVTHSEKNAGTDSGVLMTIFGDKDATKQFQLSNTKQGDKAVFESGKVNEFEMELDDVGTINRINIGQDGKGHHSNWHLDSVQIQTGSDNYNFVAKQILDQSISFIDLTPAPAKKTPSPEPVKIQPSRSVTPEEKHPPVKETPYKILIQTSSLQEDIIKEDAGFFIIIYGQNDQTEKLYLKSNKKNSFGKDEKAEFEFTTNDIGKITKIIIGQDNSDNKTVWHVDNVTIKQNNETITFNAEQIIEPNSQIELLPSVIPKKNETIYKVQIQTGAYQETGNDSNLYLTIFGQNGQTKKLPLDKTTKTNKKVSFKTDHKIEFELKTTDVGKISKILLSQNSTEPSVFWHIDNIVIKQNNNTTTFNVKRKLEKNTEIELIPLSPVKKSETPRQNMKTTDIKSKRWMKMKDADYSIFTTTGDKGADAPAVVKIRGDYGTVNIPLKETKSGEKPFQSKATDEFACRTTDVGKIQRITVEHEGTDDKILWHLKTVQIKKGNETYDFNADVRLDHKDNQVNLYPAGALSGRQKDDYVQSELRRLREDLRCASSKLRAPAHKAYEPFVYNDLRPYFDTSGVERAIYSPVNMPMGYYNRVTALRIVEPWEAFGMDYGVNYELLRQRRNRSLSSKRPAASKTADDSIDRKQGSTHLPKYPSVNIQKPAEYSRALTMADVPKIRTLIKTRYTSQANSQIDKDYKRTHDDFYRMQLDNISGYHESNRENMLQVYHSYLENTPGSRKAIRELCDQLAPKSPKPASKTTA